MGFFLVNKHILLEGKENFMAEPLFLKSQMHDKIWGGTKLRDEFGYDIPTETTGEYWAISAHPNGVSIVDNGTYKGEGLDNFIVNTKNFLAIQNLKSFHY